MNAIILAAGMGTRLRPLTNEIPKCLVSVMGTPMVEQQIRFLHEAGINDITLVSGYKAERLGFLKEKYGVEIILNEKYDTCNNIYSMYKALERFGDTWVVEGDVFLDENCFTSNIIQSRYYAKWHEHYENEWGLVTDEKMKLKDIHKGSGRGCVMSGISFWTKSNAALLRDELKSLIDKGQYETLFWDEAVVRQLKSLDVEVERFDKLYEIDTVNDLLELEKRLKR